MAGQGEQRSPREIHERAIAQGFMTPDERARFRCQLAEVKAEDEARRAAPSPQMQLDMAA